MRRAEVILENRYPHAALISFKSCQQEEYQRQWLIKWLPLPPPMLPSPPLGGNGGGGVVAGIGLLAVLAFGGVVSLIPDSVVDTGGTGDHVQQAARPVAPVRDAAPAPVVRVAPNYAPMPPPVSQVHPCI